MRIIVCGGRDYDRQDHVIRDLNALHAEMPITYLAHGAASGADSFAKAWAKHPDRNNTIECVGFPAAWGDLSHPDALLKTKNGRLYDARAGNRRNTFMLAQARPDAVVAFPGGSGTADMIRLAKEAGVRVIKAGDRRKRMGS